MKNQFKIHSIALCKNEADVIAESLLDAVKWSDYIYVYDGGSTDGTWEIVQQLNHPQIIPWKQDGKVFKEGLRAEVFNEFRHQSKDGDWWLQLNVDEFYPVSPKEVLATIPKYHDVVYGVMAEYVLTDKDIENIDFSLPFGKIKDLLKYYEVAWSEPRAFRYRSRLLWDENSAWPRHAGVIAAERILYQHYPCRSPEQLKVRWNTRIENRNRGFEGWGSGTEAWRQTIRSSKDFLYDDGTRPLKYDGFNVPNHLEKLHVRTIKNVLHRLRIWP